VTEDVHYYRILAAMNTIIILVLATVGLSAQTLRFSQPVEGILGKDVVLVNHVDQDSRKGLTRDYSCGIQTYDGHDGTDFVLRSFRQMDSGVYVLAAADGEVVTVVDSLPDRNKQSAVEREYGNYIAIRHAEGYISYYAHIRTRSARVKVGDAVKRGARMAYVGSSGNSSDPHLHFEVWQRMDPFAGNCSSDQSMWQDQPEYSTSYVLLDADVTTWPPLLDTLRERPPHADVTLSDSAVTFWSLQQGVAATDLIQIEWITPGNTSWFTYEIAAGVNSHYFYWWSYILRPTEGGKWTVVQRVNGSERARVTFDVKATTSVKPRSDIEKPRVSIHNNVVSTFPEASRIELFSVDGRLIASANEPTLTLPRTSPVVLRVTFYDGRVVGMLVR